MTAVSLFVGPRAVHVVADGSFYDAESRLVAIRSKVSVSEPLRMAIACSGRADINRIAPLFAGVANQGEAMALLPSVLAQLRAENEALAPDDATTGRNDLMLFVAAWSAANDRPEAWIGSTDRSYLGGSYSPGTMVEVTELSSPPTSIDFSFASPKRSARRLLEAQRRARWAEGDTFAHVGGFGELVTVERGGVSRSHVIKWPDIIGERINPHG